MVILSHLLPFPFLMFEGSRGRILSLPDLKSYSRHVLIYNSLAIYLQWQWKWEEVDSVIFKTKRSNLYAEVFNLVSPFLKPTKFSHFISKLLLYLKLPIFLFVFLTVPQKSKKCSFELLYTVL